MYIFPTTQQNWLEAVTSNKFSFNSQIYSKNPQYFHYTVPKINSFTTDDWSNYITYSTTKIVPNARVLSYAQSFKRGQLDKDAFLCLIEESSITYSSGNNVTWALLPFIIGFINEGNLIGTTSYIDYSPTFIQPIRKYLLVDDILMYTMYESFYNSFNNDLVVLGYSSEETYLIHQEVGRTIGTLSFKHKGNTYSEEVAIKLFKQAWAENDRVKHLN